MTFTVVVTTVIAYLKRYSLNVALWCIVALGGVVLWQLYDRVYDPLFMQPLPTMNAASFQVPGEKIQALLSLLETKQTSTVDFSSVTGRITARPTTANSSSDSAATEGIMIDSTTP